MEHHDATGVTTPRQTVKASPHRHKWMLSHGAPADPSDPWNSHAAPVSPRQNCAFAIHAMAQIKTTRRTLVILTKLCGPHTLRCTVEDSGPGIKPEHLDHLFDSFFTTKDAGMGLGLAISRSIIEAQGGCLRADNESAYGGARFSFTLPAKVH